MGSFLCVLSLFWRAQRTHDEDEVLHNFVRSMYKFVLSPNTFTTVHSAKVCLVLNKVIVFEQTLLFRCSILTLSLNHESFFDASRLHMLFGIFCGLILDH